MSDLDLGMNTWMADRFEYPERPPDRGKVLDEEKLRALKEWGRYLDVDGDAIPYRTLPGDGLPAYFCRGSGHNERGQYSERPEDYVHNVDRLARKFETARTLMPPPVVDLENGATVGVIAYGTSHWAVEESRAQMAEAGLKVSYLRLRAYPFSPDVERFIDRHARVYVVDQNRDAQMKRLLAMELTGERAAKLRSVLHYNGLPIDGRSVSDEILVAEGLMAPSDQSVRRESSAAAGLGE
jgi:2-oxoglutarate ferredoxin oxidoreductase subunit alpha